MTVRNFGILVAAVATAAFMGFGRFLFGIGGELTWWYAPLIALPYLLLQLATLNRIVVAQRRGKTVRRSPFIALTLSWLSAIAFGFTVPDLVNGELVSILSHLAGDEWIGMSIALCNPFGILAFATTIAALIFAIAAGRDARPSEDELLDDAERQMVPHPLENG